MQNDSCRLIHQNLTAFVTNPFSVDADMDFDALYKNTYMMSIISDDIVDLESRAVKKLIDKATSNGEHEEAGLWAKLLANGLDARRTGMGYTGLADTLAMMNINYDSAAGLSMIESIDECIFEAQLACTIDLAIIRGHFNAWDKSLECTESGEGTNDFFEFLHHEYPREWERMCKYGRRNVSFSTLAPTGTVSILTKTSSGVEPVFSLYYKRKRKCLSKTDRVDFVDAVGEKYTEFFVLHHAFQSWIDYIFTTKDPIWEECTGLSFTEGKIGMEYSIEMLDKLAIKSPWHGATAPEISWENRVKIQGIIQKYITHSISSTVNLPKETTEQEVGDIYIKAWELGLKGATVYVDGSRDGVLTTINDNPEDKNRQSPKRPKVLDADYHQIKSNGQQYIVLVGLLNGKPYEIFTFKPTHPVDIAFHTGKIIKKSKNHYAFNSEFINIDNLELSTENRQEKMCSIYTSMLLRHGANIEFIIKTIRKVDDTITSFTSALCRILSKYTEKEVITKEVCPECGGKLLRESGCIKCLNCGWSKCS